MSTKNFNSGFTLVELLVTIAVIGVISALAFPSMKRSIDNNKMKDVASIVFSSMQSARSHALVHGNVPMSVDLNSKNISYSYKAGKTTRAKNYEISEESVKIKVKSGTMPAPLSFQKTGKTNISGAPLVLSVCIDGSGVPEYLVTIFVFGQSEVTRGDVCA